MTIHDDESEVIEEKAPVDGPKLTIVVILSTLLGVLLTAIVAGAFLYYQNNKALQAEVLVAKDALKEKSLALDDMKAQIEVLSRQVHMLKEYSVARSNAAGEKVKKTESAAPAVLDNAAIAPKSPGAGAKDTGAPPELPIPPKAKKPQTVAQNCELVGKSPEEQAATLQRCVNLIDPPKDKARSR
ncbi:MAG: hypothetical protein JNM42_17605 [Propionivibrio sp.]|uniref:hypothetical protein n=1 Tax=Propionivibrio sp. TaxID=2212460 RepID=UPI001A4C5EF9|nr:hypothetical protein [Propionivibrio sp.]MBL8416248.1 hypothetical protein [Propionivibrio sp.]